MSFRPDGRPPVQDMPPAGGFPKINYDRVFPKRGLKGWQIWAVSSGMIMWGFYRVGQQNQKRNQQKMQERKVRYALVPFLQAEHDAIYAKQELKWIEKEKEIMKDNPKWKVGANPYRTGVWMPRYVRDFQKN